MSCNSSEKCYTFCGTLTNSIRLCAKKSKKIFILLSDEEQLPITFEQ